MRAVGNPTGKVRNLGECNTGATGTLRLWPGGTLKPENGDSACLIVFAHLAICGMCLCAYVCMWWYVCVCACMRVWWCVCVCACVESHTPLVSGCVSCLLLCVPSYLAQKLQDSPVSASLLTPTSQQEQPPCSTNSSQHHTVLGI